MEKQIADRVKTLIINSGGKCDCHGTPSDLYLDSILTKNPNDEAINYLLIRRPDGFKREKFTLSFLMKNGCRKSALTLVKRMEDASTQSSNITQYITKAVRKNDVELATELIRSHRTSKVTNQKIYEVISNSHLDECDKEVLFSKLDEYSTSKVVKNQNDLIDAENCLGIKIENKKIIGFSGRFDTPYLKFEGQKVTSIANESFLNCKILKEVEIAGGIKSVGENAFQGCSKLRKVAVSAPIKTLRTGVFSYCRVLKDVSLPPTLDAIGYSAFAFCKSLKCIEIPDGVRVIRSGAFESCESLEEIVIPASVTELQWCSFENCKALKSVIYRGKKPEISPDAFKGCISLKN